MKHNWEYKKIDELGAIKSGYTPSSDELASHGDYPYFKVAEMNLPGNEKYLMCSPSYLSGEIKTFPANSIVFPKNGAAVSTNKKRILQVDSVVDLNTAVMIANQNISVNYLYYILINIDFANLVKRGAVPTLNISELKNTIVPVPPMETQEQIVAELDQINDLIAKNRELLSQLDSLAQSLFYDTFGDPITNPKGFPIKTLKDVCILKSGDSSANRLPDGKVPYVKVGDMNLLENKQGILTSSKFVNIGNKTKLLFPIGTTIFPKRGGAILTNKKRLTKVQICCDLNIMGAIPQNIHPLYLYFFFLEKDFSELVDGSTVPQINNTDIYLLKIQVPPLALQEEFASKVEAIEAQKVKVDAEISELQNLLDARMDYWFN